MPKLVKLLQHVVWKVTPGPRRVFPKLWILLTAIITAVLYLVPIWQTCIMW